MDAHENAQHKALREMAEDIKAGRDTREAFLGMPVIRHDHFRTDFKEVVRRLIDPSKTETSSTSAEGREMKGHPPTRVRDGGWKETGWVREKEILMLSVACRIKGIKTYYSKRIDGWTHRKTESWIPKKEWEAKEWTKAEENRRAWNEWEYDPKTERIWVEDYLPDDDDLRILLNNLYSTASADDDIYSETSLDTMVHPFQNNAGW
jgi:hypothetical protein